MADKTDRGDQQHGGPKDKERDTQRSDVSGDEERSRRIKTPNEGGEHPPGMGEDEDNKYVRRSRDPNRFAASPTPCEPSPNPSRHQNLWRAAFARSVPLPRRPNVIIAGHVDNFPVT